MENLRRTLKSKLASSQDGETGILVEISHKNNGTHCIYVSNDMAYFLKKKTRSSGQQLEIIYATPSALVDASNKDSNKEAIICFLSGKTTMESVRSFLDRTPKISIENMKNFDEIKAVIRYYINSIIDNTSCKIDDAVISDFIFDQMRFSFNRRGFFDISCYPNDCFIGSKDSLKVKFKKEPDGSIYLRGKSIYTPSSDTEQQIIPGPITDEPQNQGRNKTIEHIVSTMFSKGEIKQLQSRRKLANAKYDAARIGITSQMKDVIDTRRIQDCIMSIQAFVNDHPGSEGLSVALGIAREARKRAEGALSIVSKYERDLQDQLEQSK